jgi:hypothetical protein
MKAFPAHKQFTILLINLLVDQRDSLIAKKQNPCDFFFWGCLKGKVCNSNPRTEELKEDIRREIANIIAEKLQRVNQNLFRRCEEWLHVKGQHFNTCDL